LNVIQTRGEIAHAQGHFHTQIRAKMHRIVRYLSGTPFAISPRGG
jgi:hypothetical protein